MNELISGKEALMALANGEVVEVHESTYREDYWMILIETKFNPEEILNEKVSRKPYALKFRIKPRTITINGIEVPAPIKKIAKKIKKEKGDFFVYYIDSSNCVNGYSGVLLSDLRADVVNGKYWANVLIWRTEEEIKQVVEALREVFK